MKLFNEDGTMPAGVRMMLETMLRQVAPNIADDVDVIVRFVRELDRRLAAIETQLAELKNGYRSGNPEIAGSREIAGKCADTAEHDGRD